MEHRRFLAQPEAHRPFAGGDLLRRIGGRAAVEALIDGLYDRIETDVVLRPLFNRNLTNEREAKSASSPSGWAAIPATATAPTCRSITATTRWPITRALAEKWLAHFRDALDVAVADVEARRAIEDKACVLAMALVNEGAEPSALRARPHGTCLRYKPAIETIALARRGEVSALRRLVQRVPDVLVSAPHAARLLQLAVLGGRTPVIEFLLDAGVDVNKPSPVEPLIFVTPLCAARTKGRTRIEALLLDRGAKEDIFTHAFLGDLDRLRDAIGPTHGRAGHRSRSRCA
jgi:truncated hemoglobin YjbI